MESTDLTSAEWLKSSYSSGNGQCVEVARVSSAIAMRDSKNPGGPALVFTPSEFRAFVQGISSGEFNPS